MSSAPDSERLFIDGPAGKLEALLETPTKRDEFHAVGVVCHPHPQFQGTMLNKVAHTIARAFNDLGAPALRFNFRGVGKSEGAFDNAAGETDDARAAIQWIQARWPGLPVYLGGFSFGSQVSLRVAETEPPDWLVTVAPPITRLDMENFRRPDCRWLVAQGGEDELFDARAVEEWVKRLSPPPDFEMLPKASHFFHGHLTELRERIVRHAPDRV